MLAAAAGVAAQTLPAPSPTTTSGPFVLQEALKQSTDALVALLNDPQTHQDQRDEAARRLVLRPDQDSRQILLRTLTNEGNPRGQLAVARALADEALGDRRFIDPLFSLLGPDRTLSDAAAAALGTFRNDPDVLTRLITRASSADEAANVRAAAAEGIACFPEKRAAQALITLLDASQPPPLRDEAAAALGQLTGQAQGGEEQWHQWWQSHSSLSDAQFKSMLLENRSEQYALMYGQRQRLGQDLQTLLRDQYRTGGDKTETLLRYLRSAAPIVRTIGAQLVVDDLKNAVPPAAAVKQQLRTMIGDSSPQVRLQVAQTFAAINDREALRPLLVQLDLEPDEAVRAALAAALAPIRDLDAAPALLKLLNDPSSQVAQAACRALREVGPLLRQQRPAMADEAAEDLIGMLNDRTQPGSSGLRESAIEALGSLKYPPALRPLALMLRSVETASVRRAALRALGELGDSRAQDIIIQNALDDPNRDIRLAAVEALGHTATFAAAEALYRHLQPQNEPDERVRAAAWRVLEGLFPNAPVEQLALWPDRFNDQPQRQLVVLKALAGLYAKSQDQDRLAFVQQNLGAVLMKLKQPADAAAYFGQSLQHWIHSGNNMLTQGLIRQNIDALLRAGEFDQAVAFASDMVRRNLSDQQTMGIAIRDEAQHLSDSGDKKDLPRLIAATKKMDPPLDANYTSQLQDIAQKAR